MKVIIDRIEGDTAVLELSDGTIVNAPAVLFDNPSEGAAYIIEQCDNPLSDNIKKLMDEVFDD